MNDLHIAVKGIYFDQIKDGTKLREFRLRTPYWRKRLEGRSYRYIILTRGYPKDGGVEGITRLTREWMGYAEIPLLHEHFGPELVDVFSIDVSMPPIF